MELAYLNNWLSDAQIKGICWILIHSLWIGLLTAALAALVIACTTKAKAQLRYTLFCSLLLFFMVAMSLATAYELNGSTPVNTLIQAPENGSPANTPTAPLPFSTSFSVVQTLADFFNRHASSIFVLWLVFFTLKCMRLLIGIFYIQRIRTYKVQTLATPWTEKVKAFAQHLGIKQQVAVIQSALVKVPLTLGYLRPVIVLPIGLVLQLPAAQVEAILWHELAHIYRRDYLVNILQKMVEAVFFFNPAILWLSTLIRDEREACCDDIVLVQSPQKTSYMAALMAFNGIANNAGSLTMALSVRTNPLMQRLRRIAHQENKRLSFLELLVMVLGFGLLTAFATIPQVQPPLQKGVGYLKETIQENFTSDDATPTRQMADQELREVPVATTSPATTPLAGATLSLDTPVTVKSEEELMRQKQHKIAADLEVRADKRQVVNFELANLQVLKKSASDTLKEVRIVGTQVPAREKKQLPRVDASADKARVLGVINSLIQQKTVPDAAAVKWFALTDEQLVVNGEKQPAALHQQLKEKYGVRANYGLFFGPTKVHGTGIVFDKKDL